MAQSPPLQPQLYSPKEPNLPSPKHESSISSLLNSKPQENFLPTPVTPGNPPTKEQPEDGGRNPFGFFSSQDSMTTQSKQSTPEKTFTCPECNQTFSRPHNLKSHLTIHSAERPYECGVCSHPFRRHHDLKRHQKLHTGERPHVCQNCRRSFARLDALNRHQRAEGGTACGAVHQRREPYQDPPSQRYIAAKESPSHTSATPASFAPARGVAPRRPVIPQLNIPLTSSQPYPNQSYPHPPSSNTNQSTPNAATSHSNHGNNKISNLGNNNTTSHTNSSTNHHISTQSRLNKLPSPGALSSLPVSESTNLVPLYCMRSTTPTTTPSVASATTATTATTTTSTSTTATNSSHQSPPGTPEKPAAVGLSSTPATTIPRLDSPYSWPFPPSPHRHHPSTGNSPLPAPNTPQWDRLEHENALLKQEVARQQNASGPEIAALKQRVHDLEVENKVLRSLIVGNQETLTEKRSHCQISIDPLIKHEEDNKKKRFA
ncbi:hypothetical protein CLU79DRAFT_740492 [Phycomyces nitens]|nr:hypothetical protein CLU79DRAFT_740492 [Phycomyces nitens]